MKRTAWVPFVVLIALVGSAAVVMAAGSASAGVAMPPPPVDVAVGPNGRLVFSPAIVSVDLGGSVHWVWKSSPHSSTDADGSLGLWDSGVHNTGHTFDYMFTAAATYNYDCSVHVAAGMTGQIKVSPLVPATGTTTTPITIKWAIAAPPAGEVYDVQQLPPGATTWVALPHQDRGLSKTTTLRTAGTWEFRARIRHPKGSHTDWSPQVAVSIS